MTLITAVASAGWLAIAADRRLTWDNNPERTRDLENKVAILRRGRLVVGYAGDISWLPDDIRFEGWLLDATSTAQPHRQMAVLRDALQFEWNKSFDRPGPAFGVLGVGYRVQQGSGALTPFITAVSNAMDEKFDFNPYKVRDVFTVKSVGVPPGKFYTATMGFAPDQYDEEQLGVELKPMRTLDSVSVGRVRAALVDFHLATAEQANGVVGTQTMIVTVGKGAWPIEEFAIELEPSASRDYSQSAIAHTHNDNATKSLPYTPSFGPAFDQGDVMTLGGEVQVGATGFIGPGENLRQIAW